MNATSGIENKMLSWDQLSERLNDWRADGDEIVFTNGCFDVFHFGHASLLQWACLLADRLIVGINSDQSATTIKQPPMFGQHARSFVIASLQVVDAVVRFDETTPLNLVKHVRPDVLVKGGDYAKKLIVGAAEVTSWGGRVALAPYIDGFSSSSIRNHDSSEAS